MLDDSFVGRSEELARLERSWRAATGGRFSIVNVTGPPGMGKTALIERFIRDHAVSACVVQGIGDELECTLPFSVISQMIHTAQSLPSVARAVLGELTDSVAVGSGLLNLLAEAPLEAPLLICVDDAQWCDVASLEALAFTFRRLRDEPVMALFGTRTGSCTTRSRPLERLTARRDAEVIALKGLLPSELEELAAQRGLDRSRGLVDRVYRHTGGNPLYASAMFDHAARCPEMASAPWTPLVAPEPFGADVRNRLAQCTPDARQFAAALSILGLRAPILSVAHLSEVDDALAAVDSLVGTALVSCELGIVSEVAFAHPLIRSAIYHALDASACAALHVRAASLSDEPAMALHHRVAASHGHDPVLADELLTVGRIEATAGDLVSAAARYEAAGQLTSDARVRERSLVEQFECFWASGDSMSAEAVLDQFEPGSRSPARTYIEGALAIGLARAGGEALLFDVWEGPNSYSWLRSRAAGVLAPHLANQGRGSDVLRAASCWYEAEPDDLFPWSLPLTALQASLLQLGRVQEAIEMAADIERRPDIEIRDLDALIGRGMIREFIDDLTGARADLGFVYQATRRRSARFALVALIHLAETEYRAGAWDSSIAHGELAASLACDTEQHWCAALAHAVAAMPLAGRGAIEPAEAHVAKAHRCAAAAADPVNFLWAATAEARVAHARGEPEAVVRALEVLTRRAPGDDVEPGFQPWRALLAEALVQLGQFDEAEQALRVFEHSAVVLERRSALVTAARVRGQLEHARQRLGAADDAFDRGAAQAIGLPNEFEVGLFDLARARYLRRARRRGAATTALRTARRRFFGLGALPYVEMCDAELAAVGAGTQRRERTDAHDLTPQELAVARLVTTGLTNREVATELYLSVKTVEYHLGKVFTKLGISSRTQLAQRMNAGRTGL